jgi:hypothetical protein
MKTDGTVSEGGYIAGSEAGAWLGLGAGASVDWEKEHHQN